MKPLIAKQITINNAITKGVVAWGVTDGKKWHAYAFPTKDQAEKLISQIPDDKEAREVNVGYPGEYVMLKG